MKFHTIEEAQSQSKKLIPITEWLSDNSEERDFLKRANVQVMMNPGRCCMFVKNKLGEISLYANCIVERRIEDKRKPFKSKSGKYKNARHLIETLFSKDQDLSFVKCKCSVLTEFPESTMDCNTFYQYRHMIVAQKKFMYVPFPEWAK